MRRRNLAYVKTVRSKGRTYLYFDTGITKDGKTEYKRLPDKSDKRFGAVYAAMLGHRARRKEETLTVPDLVAKYQAGKHFAKLAEASQKIYKTYQARFAEALPTAPAGEIERKDIVALFDKMGDTPAAANMMLASVAALYRWGRRGELVSNRPCDDIDPNELGEHDPWPEELVEAALSCDDAIIKLAVHLLYFTAQRIGDVSAMRWSQVVDGTVMVRQTKTDKDMVIAIHPRLAKELDKRPRDLRTILVDAKGKRFSPTRLRLVIQEWAGKRDQKVVPHGLRKNAVNSLLEVGCSVAEVAAVSGQSLRMIEHYARKRNTAKLARSAIAKWSGTDHESGNGLENSADKRG